MLQKIMFQDNMYQLSRSLDILQEGLLLDLAPEFFFEKTVDDILFFDSTLQKLSVQLEGNPHMSGYLNLLHSLNSCQKKFLAVIDSILTQEGTLRESFSQLEPKLRQIKKIHSLLNDKTSHAIMKNDNQGDSRDIVSQNELSELLNF